MFTRHQQIYKNTEVEAFKYLMWKWRSQEGPRSVHLPWEVSKLTQKGLLAMELFLTVPALFSCSVGVHGHASWRIPPEYALFHSVNCAHLPGEASHFLSILSVCHLPNVPCIVSKQPLSQQCYCWTQLFFFFVIYRCAQQFRKLSSWTRRLHLQLKLPTILSLAWADLRPLFPGTLLGHPDCSVVVANSSFFLYYQGLNLGPHAKTLHC